MELINGMGMYKASLIDDEQEDIVSGIIYSNEYYSKCHTFCNNFEEVFNYHQKCIKEYYEKLYTEKI